MHKVQRAIIMAAGLGNRMRPVTLTTPKPLVKVNGIRMIDTVIEGLHQNGIYEIYVVVGYLKDQFMGLEQEYPGVRLIENPYYDTCSHNNCSLNFMHLRFLTFFLCFQLFLNYTIILFRIMIHAITFLLYMLQGSI